MKWSAGALLTVIVATGTAGIGYWWGTSRSEPAATAVGHVSGPSDDGRAAQRRILYYRHPMGLPDTSPVPKKDAMGMDYVPVYEGDEPAAGGPIVNITLDKVQKLGVRTEPVASRRLSRTIRAVATIQADERRRHTVAPKFEGWIQTLHVNTTGQAVRRGEVLMEIYSPDLITAQQEYLIASKGLQSVQGSSPDIQASMQRLMDSAVQRLRNWDISEAELRRLRVEGRGRQYLSLRSPVDGVVLGKPPIAGMRFMAGEVLFRIADLSSVWMLADVFEQDLGMVHLGQSAKIAVEAYPDQIFAGTVTFIYPTLTAETRTAKVRIELPNSHGLLKPDMYASAEFASSHGDKAVLAVPDSAVLDTGTRQLVLVQRGEGRFEPRSVTLGMRADGYLEVREGLEAGEEVVVAANFLIDAESQLKAALGAFGGHGHGGGTPGAQETVEPATEGHADHPTSGAADHGEH